MTTSLKPPVSSKSASVKKKKHKRQKARDLLIRHQPRKCKVNDSLIKHSKNVTSQSGEDGIIDALFALIDKHTTVSSDSRASARPRLVVEFGCWDGKHLSNSWHLIKDLGWRGVLIEADSSKFDELQANYHEEVAAGQVTLLNHLVSFDSRYSSLVELYGSKGEAMLEIAEEEKDESKTETVPARELHLP